MEDCNHSNGPETSLEPPYKGSWTFVLSFASLKNNVLLSSVRERDDRWWYNPDSEATPWQHDIIFMHTYYTWCQSVGNHVLYILYARQKEKTMFSSRRKMDSLPLEGIIHLESFNLFSSALLSLTYPDSQVNHPSILITSATLERLFLHKDGTKTSIARSEQYCGGLYISETNGNLYGWVWIVDRVTLPAAQKWRIARRASHWNFTTLAVY